MMKGLTSIPSKNFFKHPRPYYVDATIKPVCKATDNRMDFGYPSGHGTTGYLEALVLIQIVPEKRAAIMARADDHAHKREVCGAHFASNKAASTATAYAMMAIMLSSSQFQTELAAAEFETCSLLGL
jgi:acid phosphatase (class A)